LCDGADTYVANKSAGLASHAMNPSSVKNKNAAEMGKRDDNDDAMGQEIIARRQRVCHLFTFRLAHCCPKPFPESDKAAGSEKAMSPCLDI
jgi:hypothetical protein